MTITAGAEREAAAVSAPNALDDDALLDAGRRVLRIEGEAVLAIAGRLGPDFVAAVRLLHEASGRTLVSGIGKSGIIARKIAATLTSTGTPATFLHPVEGLHGDLGIVGQGDVAIVVSKSGESGELSPFIEHLSRRGVALIALTGGADSMVARVATVALDCSVREEACPHDLAPTSSTTAALAMGDAIAVALLQLRGFTRDDFARLHPGGTLGRKLTLRVRDVMLEHDLPALPPHAPMRQCIVLLAEKRGTVAIIDDDSRVIGVVTAGDLTRLMERTSDIFDVPVATIMTRDPRVVAPDALAAAAIYQMEKHGIMAMPVIADERRLVGIVHLHDLLRSGVI
jgi:arabinose-5-phosphate isomerase